MIQESMNFDANQEVESFLDQIRKDIEEANMTIIQASSTWNSGLSAFINRNGHKLDFPVPVGKTDTSAAAAKKITITAGTLRADVLDLLYNGPKTTTEIANALKKDKSGIQPRTSELSTAGYIKDSKIRRRNLKGNTEIVWQVCVPIDVLT